MKKEKDEEEEEKKKDKCQLMYVEKMTEIEKPTFANHQSKNCFRKDNQ